MLKREEYLNQLIMGKDKELIKVITGVRRCGKSTLLLQYKDYLIKHKIKKEDIIYMNFESAEFYDIVNYRDLYQYIKQKYNENKNRKYVLLDEVQNIERWEKAVNSMLVDMDCDIYITGSNAYLLSSELTTLLAGRVLTIKIYPFSFEEYLNINSSNENNISNLFDEYLKYGGMPMISNMQNNDHLILNYLDDLKEVLLKKDVISRNNIKNVVFLDNLIKYMASNIGNLTTPCNIAEFMKKNGSSITNETVDSYLKMLENAYFIYRVPRYELKGKQLLKTQGKYYFIDSGLRNIINGISGYDSGSSYENIVYLELLRRGFEVYVGKYNDIEIDFVAIKPNEKIYYQVSRSIIDPIVEEREKKSLLAINDSYKKVILTMDNVKNKQLEGIEIINIIDFLLDRNK